MNKLKIPAKTIIIYITAFVTGAIILVLEILGTRIVAPFYGTTIFVWSSLIGITMVGLAIGYFAGGAIADKRPDAIVLSLIIVVASIAIILIRTVSRPVLLATDFFGPRFGPLASAAILFIVPMVLLGMTTPFYVKLVVSELKNTGKGAGSLYSTSTVGSVLGAILSGLILIPLLGIDSLLDMMSIALAIVSIVVAVVAKSRSKLSAVPILLGAAVIIAILVINLIPKNDTPISLTGKTKLITDIQSTYSRIRVFDYAEKYRTLLVEGAIQTMYDRVSGDFPSSYLKYFDEARKIRGNAKRALVIGLGGGGLDKMFRETGIELTNVEIDPEIETIAKKYFDYTGKTVIDDGRHFLRSSKEKYDIIYLDAFSGFSIAPHLLTEEAFRDAAARLSDGGILCINSIGKIRHDDTGEIANESLTPSLFATISRVFAHVVCKASDIGLTNIITYASNSPFEIENEALDFTIPDSKIVYTDNSSQAELFSSYLIEEWREEMKASLANVFPL
jgi:spermidine synthase